MHIHSLKRAAVAACVVTLAAVSNAAAATVPAELRVEADGAQDLTHGWTYYSDSATIETDTSQACGGSGQEKTMAGATALGILEHARRQNDRLDPLQVSDRFDFGLLVCGIGGFVSDDSSFWTFKVNHVAPTVGAEQYQLKAGDDVLWAFSSGGSNTGNELELVAPRTADAGEPIEVTVNQYDFEGNKSPAEGAQVGGTVTDAEGKATVALDSTDVLRAYRGSDIPSAPTRICVGSCQKVAMKRIFGATTRDVIRADGDFAEYVYAAGGNDRIDVRGDSFSDRVTCGAGRDTVLADRRDRVARDCEKVTRG
jgi:hypothetical protein